MIALVAVLGPGLRYLKSQSEIDVKLELESIDNDGNVRFKLTNYGPEVNYSGYGRSAPLYSIERQIAGKWQFEDIDYCGNGISSTYLKTGESSIIFAKNYKVQENWRVSFSVHRYNNYPYWLKSICRYLEIEDNKAREIYSPTIPYTKEVLDLPEITIVPIETEK